MSTARFGNTILSTSHTNALAHNLAKALVLQYFGNSWGGTRTRDPGIMSAVL